MYSKYFFLTMLVALSSATAYAGVYKWTDEDGKIHYSQTRPSSDIEAESLRIHGRKPQSDSTSDTDADKKKAEDKKKEQSDKKQESKLNAENAKNAKAVCQTARKRLSIMKSTGRIRERDEKGNVNYLSDKQKKASMKKEQEVIKKFCK